MPVAAVDTGRAEREFTAATLSTSADYFRTTGMKVIAGESFEERENGEPAVVVSESLAKRLAGGSDKLIGHHIRLGTNSRYRRLRVIGVISDAQINLATRKTSPRLWLT